MTPGTAINEIPTTPAYHACHGTTWVNRVAVVEMRGSAKARPGSPTIPTTTALLRASFRVTPEPPLPSARKRSRAHPRRRERRGDRLSLNSARRRGLKPVVGRASNIKAAPLSCVGIQRRAQVLHP